jgi:hypothetical protein
LAEQHKELFIKTSLEKSQEAWEVAQESIDNKRWMTALNRIYYAIFYTVTALGYKYDFKTSKHSALKGWFNKKIISEDKLVGPELHKVYQAAFENRQESDYKMTYVADEEFIRSLFVEAEKFIEEINRII